MPFASNSSSACAEVAHRKTNAQSSMSGRLMTTMLRRCLLSTASKPSNGHPTKASSSSTTTTTITSTTDVDGGVSTPHRHGPDCWSCGARDDKSMFFCQHCDAIQAPRANTTAFDVFDCAESFDVDVQQLSQRFKQLQVKLHPDKWATRTPVRWLVYCCDAADFLLNTLLSFCRTNWRLRNAPRRLSTLRIKQSNRLPNVPNIWYACVVSAALSHNALL